MGPVKKERAEDVLIDAQPDRYFKAWMDHEVLIPKLFAELVDQSSFQGNPRQPGATVELIYPTGKTLFTGEYSTGKDKFKHTLVDYQKRMHVYEALEGELMERCKFYRGTLEVVPAEAGTKCIVRHLAEFEIRDGADQSFSSAHMEKTAIDYYHRLEAYLKAHPAEYHP